MDHPRMAPVDEPEDTEPDDQEAGADLDLPLPFDEGDEQREWKEHQAFQNLPRRISRLFPRSRRPRHEQANRQNPPRVGDRYFLG
jgi:hypothetical protein